MKKGDKNYVDKVELLYETILSKGKGCPTDKLYKMWILLVENILHKNTNRYMDEAIRGHSYGESIIDLKRYYINFNPIWNSSIFAYYTQIINNSIKKSFNIYTYNGTNKDERKRIIRSGDWIVQNDEGDAEN
jgi:hypothetical protein